MNRNEARAKTIDILLGDQNLNADFYASLFEQYNYEDSEMTPISPSKMGNVSINNNVVITEEVYKELIKIRSITQQTNQEVSFLIFGEEKPNGTAWLDTVISTYQPSARTSASFDGINKSLNEYVKDIENGEFNITFTPEERKPVKEYLSQQKRFKHLEEEQIEKIQKYVDAQCSELGL